MSEEVLHLPAGLTPTTGSRPDNNEDQENNTRRPRRYRAIWLSAAAVAVVALLALGIIPRLRAQAALSDTVRDSANTTPNVSVVAPQKPPATVELSLPGTTQALQETIVSARTNGYVRRTLVDIGDHVREGQVLAEIETPELDQQLLQAKQELAGARLEIKQAEQNVNRANQDVDQVRQNFEQAQTEVEQAVAGLKQTKTNRDLAKVTLTRSKNLVEQGIVARQETDERQAQFDVQDSAVGVSEAAIRNRQANIKAVQATINSKLADVAGLKELVEARKAQAQAQEANVARIVELQAFGRVTAPFSGVITARSIETGSLITPNGGTTGGNAANADAAGLFKIARIDAIRTFVDVPQTSLASIFPGLTAEVHIREYPDIKFEGRVLRTASALDSTSRTLPVEVLIPNDEGKLMPGMYSEVKFNLEQTAGAFLIPSGSLIIKPEGTFVATVTADKTVHFKQIQTGRESGKLVEALSGLDGTEQIVPTPVDGLKEGAVVTVEAASAEAKS